MVLRLSPTPQAPRGYLPALRVPAKKPSLPGRTADFGIYEHSEVPSLNALADLRAVASRTLAASRSDLLATLVPADVLDAHNAAGSPRSGPRSLTNPTVRPGFMAPPTAAGSAAGVIAALHILITTGTKKGQHPSPATVMRMLREHDEHTTAMETTG